MDAANTQSDTDLRIFCAELVCKSNITVTSDVYADFSSGMSCKASLAKEAELLYKFIKGESTSSNE